MIDGLARAARMLDLFSSDVPEWTVSDVARELDLPKTTTWEWMQSLTELGFIRRSGPTRYRLGWRAFALGNRARMTSEIARAARAELEVLVAQFGETVHLATRHGRDVVYLEKSAPRTGIRSSITRVGERLPAHCTAVGKVLLASLPPEEVNNLYEGVELTALTEHSITDSARLAAELAQVAQAGAARDMEEVLEGMCCVAAPVTNRHGDVVWGLGMSFLEYKLAADGDRYTAGVVAAAARLSALEHDDNVPAPIRPREARG